MSVPMKKTIPKDPVNEYFNYYYYYIRSAHISATNNPHAPRE